MVFLYDGGRFIMSAVRVRHCNLACQDSRNLKMPRARTCFCAGSQLSHLSDGDL